MPNVWFYKLRDMGRLRESQRRLQRSTSSRDEFAINLPRNSYHFSRIQRVNVHPALNQRASGEQAMQKAQVVDIEPVKRKAASKGKKSKSGFSIESRISASCSCGATVESVSKTGERNEEFWSSDEQEAVQDYLSKKSQYKKKSFCTQFMDQNQFALELESKSGNWKLPGHQFNVAGLPSPVHEDFSQVQPLEKTVKDMIELVRDPFVLNSSFIRSNSGNCRLNCASSKEEEGLKQAPVSFLDINSPDLYSIWATDMEEKQRFLQYLEECKPSITRPRHGQNSEYGIKEPKGSEKKSVPARKKPDAGKLQFSNDVGTRALKKHGKSRPHLGKNNSRACSPKPNGMDWRSNSFAVVKSSSDPQRDFIESMVEMIIEKNIHCYGDLQRLLECYLSLNPSENHDMIVKAFERVRSDFIEMSSSH
ncbi:hypothetical protein SUGI_0263000 [Cryptomeria japonica]|nr:hypothetical protein SUGI_0263000 [Cryptomeria japonica]